MKKMESETAPQMDKSPKNFSFGSFSLSVLIGVGIGAFIGALCGAGGGYLAYIFSDDLGISSQEGGQGYFVMFVGTIVTIIGFLVGSITTLYHRGHRTREIIFGLIAEFFLTAALIVSGVSVWYSFQSMPVVTNGLPPKLYFEIKPPAGSSALKKPSELSIDLNTDENSMPAQIDLPTEGETKSVVSGFVELYFKTSKRIIVLRLPQNEVRLFNLKLPSSPLGEKYQQWSEWYKADWLDKPGLQQPEKIGAGPEFEIRYRVEVAQ